VPRSRDCHVVSLVVHVLPARADAAAPAIGRVPGAEVCASDGAGRFVVLLEADDEARILAAFRELESLAGVLSVALVYHEVDAA